MVLELIKHKMTIRSHDVDLPFSLNSLILEQCIVLAANIGKVL